ncbi:MAG: RraA family protein [Sphaerochaeta sp.]|jgi:regulator of RNase E activity RraA|nr:RraA family protein [Sphaerochaeta sp.]
MIFTTREELISITPQWKGERFADGRPKVADRYLEALRQMTLEELWKVIFVKGYENQFIAMKSLHPEFKESGDVNCKLVGRAVTAMYAPSRPDYHEASLTLAQQKGLSGTPNQWVIDSLTEGDVIVIDMYDKIYKGTFVGGNLLTAIKTKTIHGGAVIWGGIRDVEQMQKVPDVQVYYRGIDPTPIRDFSMLQMNGAIRLGQGREAAICLPGDIVYGCSGGVLFIPPHLVASVVDGAFKTQIKDLFGFYMISLNRFTTAQIDKHIWTKEMLDQLIEFIQTDPKGEAYRGIDWSEEYSLANDLTAHSGQSAL